MGSTKLSSQRLIRIIIFRRACKKGLEYFSIVLYFELDELGFAADKIEEAHHR
jgi:hypothetical protein